MNPIFIAAAEVQQLWRAQSWRACFIGGLAVLRWGEPRLTRDVDLTIVTGLGGEGEVIDALLTAFPARVEGAREFALRHRVVLLRAGNGVPLDVALGALPFEERMAARATGYVVGDGAALVTCSAEDLVVQKVFAGRARDWSDVEGIVHRRRHHLDVALIWRELEPLLEASGAAVEDSDRLSALLRAAR